jgi:hypothetical protein
MRKTPREVHAAPFRCQVRADMSDVRVGGLGPVPCVSPPA